MFMSFFSFSSLSPASEVVGGLLPRRCLAQAFVFLRLLPVGPRWLLEASCQTRTAEHQSADEGGRGHRTEDTAHVSPARLEQTMLLASMMAETFGSAWLLAVTC